MTENVYCENCGKKYYCSWTVTCPEVHLCSKGCEEVWVLAGGKRDE